MPFAFGRGRPALTMPSVGSAALSDQDLRPDGAELKLALAAVKPDAVPVRVMTKKGALRLTMPPPGKPFSRPPTPVA